MWSLHYRKQTAVAAIAIIAGGVIAIDFAQSLRADTSSQAQKDLYSEKCSACHNLPDPAAEAMSAVKWRATVDRMLYKHGASDSITPDQAATIVTYLAAFAPKDTGGQGRLRRSNPNFSDVWATDPIYSHVYRFRTPDSIAAFRNIAGKYAVQDLATGPQLVAVASTPGKPALLVAPTPGPHTDLQLEADFSTPQTGLSTPSTAPVSFGVTFDTDDANNYYVARYDDAKHALDLARVQNGVESMIQTQPMTSGLSKTPDGWHKLKVAVINGRAKVWLDFEKKIDVTLPDVPGSGGAGIWTASRAAARSFTLDIYPTDVPNVAA